MVEPEGLRCCGRTPLGACPELRQILPRYFRGVTSRGSKDTEIPEMHDLDTVTGVPGGGVHEMATQVVYALTRRELSQGGTWPNLNEP